MYLKFYQFQYAKFLPKTNDRRFKQLIKGQFDMGFLVCVCGAKFFFDFSSQKVDKCKKSEYITKVERKPNSCVPMSI